MPTPPEILDTIRLHGRHVVLQCLAEGVLRGDAEVISFMNGVQFAVAEAVATAKVGANASEQAVALAMADLLDVFALGMPTGAAAMRTASGAEITAVRQ